MTAELVGPIRTLRLPNEDLNEYRLMYLAAHDAVQEVLAGHRTWPQSYAVTETYWLGGRLVHEYDWDEGSCCSCTGCVIARKAYLR